MTTDQSPNPELSGGAYEIIRRRLQSHGAQLREQVEKLNAARQEVFGGIQTALIGTERVLTDNNCIPRDMVAIGTKFLFGYNVQLGLRKEMVPKDVFSLFCFEDNGFVEEPLQDLLTPDFVRDFKELYTYYKDTRFVKFAVIGPHVHDLPNWQGSGQCEMLQMGAQSGGKSPLHR